MTTIVAMKVGTPVYHVANPTVRGVLVGYEHFSSTIPYFGFVRFDEPVCFSGNKPRGAQTEWVCTLDYLYPTSELAQAAHVPGR